MNYKRHARTYREIRNKILLLIELPVYPFLKMYLLYMLSSSKRRKHLYLSTKRLVLFRRLHLFILDRMFVMMVRNYSIPSYKNELAGFILDLKHLVANRSFIEDAFNNNYRFSLGRIRDIVKFHEHGTTHIIDVGAGSGVLTKAIADLDLPHVRIVGIEIRPETVEYNTILYPEILWKGMRDLPRLISQFGAEHVLIVMNGVLNFMSEEELRIFLSYKVKNIVWFYHTSASNRSELVELVSKIISVEREGYTHYNLGFFLKEYGYSFKFEFIPASSGGGGFVSTVSSAC